MPTDPILKQGRCPRCGKKFQYESVAIHKYFPFCSARCRDIDLGNWFSGTYAIPGPEGSAYAGEDEEFSPDRDAT